MSDLVSDLKPYSLGVVVETKPRGTDYILVSPMEVLNVQTPGLIKEYNKTYKGDQKDLESKSFKTEHEAKNYLKAKWLPFGESNRTSAPDVVANETVMIYKLGDVDEYYWFDIMREPELRRLEDVLYSYSNKPKGIDAFDKESSYWLRYNTKDKYIHLHTSKNDGEPFIYDIIINTKEGHILVTDDIDNYIKLDSAISTVTINTQRDIHLIAKRDITFTADRNIVSKAGMNIIEEAGLSITELAPTITDKATIVTHSTPKVHNTGMVITDLVDIAHPNANAAH